MKLRYIVIAGISLIIIYLVIHRINANKLQNAKGEGRGKGKGGKGEGAAPVKVSGFVTKHQSFDDKITVTGSVSANEQIDIRTQVSGVIERLQFKEGANVTKGQVLIKIEDSELQARRIEAQTREDLAKETEQRAKLLLQKEAISQEEYQVALADLRALQAQTQLIKAQLAKTIITAPFQGQIGLRSVSEGSFITPDLVIAKLVDKDQVKITFSIPEKYAHQISVNSVVDFTIAGISETLKARVYAIQSAVDPSTRTLEVRAIAPNKNNQIVPGSFATIHLSLNSIKNAILIPSEAIIPIQNGKKVFVKKDGKAKEVMIKTSTRTSNLVLVDEGLKQGDTVLTSGIMILKNESPVVVSSIND